MRQPYHRRTSNRQHYTDYNPQQRNQRPISRSNHGNIRCHNSALFGTKWYRSRRSDCVDYWVNGFPDNIQITHGIFGGIKTTYTNDIKKRIKNVRNKKSLRINGRQKIAGRYKHECYGRCQTSHRGSQWFW